MLVKLKENWNIIEVYKWKLGYYYHLNSKNKTKKYTKKELIFITYL